jgi:hypothetical protein
MTSKPTFTLVVCHFGDPFWVVNALSSLGKVNLSEFTKILVIDQNRGDQELKKQLEDIDNLEILIFPQYSTSNIDHGTSLNLVLKSYSFASSHIMIIDSDLIMQNDDWKQSIDHMLIDNDCVLALEPSQFFITHPCFMVFPTKTVNEIDFLAGVYDLKADTGRLVGLQLHDFKMRIKFLHPITAYGGALGYVYPEINAHHVTSVSIRQLSRNMLGKSVFKMQVAENWRKWLVFSKVSTSMNLFSIRILQIGFVFVQIARLAKFWIISKFKL